VSKGTDVAVNAAYPRMATNARGMRSAFNAERHKLFENNR
jgi:hypothetical protein